MLRGDLLLGDPKGYWRAEMKWERESDKVAAFESIFKQYYSSLVGFFTNRGFLRMDSEDLAQETLLKVYRGYDRFRRGASDATWIFSIAINVLKNELRSKKAKKRYGENISLDTSNNLLREIEALGVPIGQSSPLAMVLRKEQEEVIQEVAQELPPKMRNSFVLYYSGKFSHDEIAEILGIESNTVKSHVAQAKEKLIEVVRRRYPEFFVGGGGDDSQDSSRRP
jgi:RNA polymerase sigma factor (sigma-70 family)